MNGAAPKAAQKTGSHPASAKSLVARQKVGATVASPSLDTEALLRSTLDSLSAHIAVLDKTGTIITVNQAWRAFASASGYAGDDHGIGTNYLRVCEQSAPFSADAAKTAKALRDIIAGKLSEYRMEYPCMGPDGPRWFQLRVTRPDSPEIQRIVVAHEDITEVKEAYAALTRVTARLMKVQDNERRAIARELHDTTAQNLLAVSMNTMRLRDRFRDAPESARRLLNETLELTEQSLQEVRTLSYVLHPPLLDVMGLPSALKWLAKGFSERSGIEIETKIADILEPLPQDAATAFFRVTQEGLANIHRHSRSRWGRITLRRTRYQVRLEIVDRGCGFQQVENEAGGGEIGVGISGMRLRLEQIGGQLQIKSGRTGTRITATIALKNLKICSKAGRED
jgi:two-component system, NarL family, sensor kinase